MSGTRLMHGLLLLLLLLAAASAVDYEAELTALYKEHAPAKVHHIPGLLSKYKGAEAKLLAKVRDKYGKEDEDRLTVESSNTRAAAQKENGGSAPPPPDEGDFKPPPDPNQSVQAMITQIYEAQAPRKVAEIPKMMEKYVGSKKLWARCDDKAKCAKVERARKRKLLTTVRRKYGIPEDLDFPIDALEPDAPPPPAPPPVQTEVGQDDADQIEVESPEMKQLEPEEESQSQAEGVESRPFAYNTESTGVVEITNDLFTNTVKPDRKNIWLVEFYSPDCGQLCKNLQPHIESLGKAMQGVKGIKIGAADATVHTLADKMNIYHSKDVPIGYPVLVFFKNGRKLKFTGKEMKAKVIAQQLLKKASGGGFLGDPKQAKRAMRKLLKEWPVTAEEKAKKAVRDQATPTKQSVTADSDEDYVNQFGSPTWDGYSSKGDAEYAKESVQAIQAQQLTSQKVLNACTSESVIPSKIPDPDAPKPADWDDEEDGPWVTIAESLRDVTPQVPNPVCDQTGVICGDFTPLRLCIVAFLPNILDSSAKERKRYIAVLERTAKRQESKSALYHQPASVRVVWAEGKQQEALENELGLFPDAGYPVVLVLSERRHAAVTMRSSFDEKSIGKFLSNLLTGKVASSQVYNKDAVASSVHVTETWNGKDVSPATAQLLDEL